MKTTATPLMTPPNAKPESGTRAGKAPPDLAVALPEGDELPDVFALPPDPEVNDGVARGVETPAGRVAELSTPVNVSDAKGFPRALQASSNSIGHPQC